MGPTELQVPVLVVVDGVRCWIGKATGTDRCPHLAEHGEAFRCRLFKEDLIMDRAIGRPFRAAACQMQAFKIKSRPDR